jgi:hypothetical protein
VRMGILGISDAPPAVGITLVAALCSVAVASAWLLLRSGYRLRS